MGSLFCEGVVTSLLKSVLLSVVEDDVWFLNLAA